MTTRRQFLKAGVIGGLALAGAGLFYSRGLREAPGYGTALGPRARLIVAAVAPAILAGVLPDEPQARRAASERIVSGVDTAIAGLSAAAQEELGELFALLAFAPARMLLAGVGSSWERASPEEVAAFLERWRSSRFALLQSAYAALHDLVLGAWYGDAGAWPAIAYPGPPEVL